VLPLAADEKLSRPGCDAASAMSSFTELAFTDGCSTSTLTCALV
jgi:hypothetical protein